MKQQFGHNNKITKKSIFTVSPWYEWIIVFVLLIMVITITSISTYILFSKFSFETKHVLGTLNKTTISPVIYSGVATEAAYLTQNYWDGYEQDTGKKVSIFHEYLGVDTSTCTWLSFPANDLGTTLLGTNTIRNHGAIPMLTLMTGDKLSDILDKNKYQSVYDACFTKIAQGAAAWGKPFFLRLNHEMNHGFSYGPPNNTAKQYVTFWKHVHDIFVSQKATNATWVWCPNVETNSSGNVIWPAKPYYPGDTYVDWTCIDGYNYQNKSNKWQSFDSVFNYTYRDVTKRIAPSKPLMIGEYSSGEDPYKPWRKAQWFTTALTLGIQKNFPLIKALVVWNGNNYGMDDRIESSPASLQAFKKGMSLPYYASNEFGSIECSDGWCPIKPLQVTQTETPTPSLTNAPTP